jgi:hypothetical protein
MKSRRSHAAGKRQASEFPVHNSEISNERVFISGRDETHQAHNDRKEMLRKRS